MKTPETAGSCRLGAQIEFYVSFEGPDLRSQFEILQLEHVGNVSDNVLGRYGMWAKQTSVLMILLSDCRIQDSGHNFACLVDIESA